MHSLDIVNPRGPGLDENWFTVEQIAKRLQVAERTVRRWLTTGELNGANFGGKAGWRVRGHDLDTFIARRFGERATGRNNAS